jgi:hypothetical protein
MATLRQKIETERRFRELIEEQGLPAPDAIEYGYTCIRAYYFDTKQVFVIDAEPGLPGPFGRLSIGADGELVGDTDEYGNPLDADDDWAA